MIDKCFFLALRARSRALSSLADVFEKNEKKDKIMSVYREVYRLFTLSEAD